jgi:hypothetical protein
MPSSGHVADVDRPVGSIRADAVSPLDVVDNSVQVEAHQKDLAHWFVKTSVNSEASFERQRLMYR